MLDNATGTVIDHFAIMTQIMFYYWDGTEWIRRFRGLIANSNNLQQDAPLVHADIVGYDTFLFKNKVSADYTTMSAGVTLRPILISMIKHFTPLPYPDTGDIELNANPAGMNVYAWQGIALYEVIAELLQRSANEDFGVDGDGQFWTREIVTARGAGQDASTVYTTGNYYDFEFQKKSTDEFTRVEVHYDVGGTSVAVAEDRTRINAVTAASGLNNDIVWTKELTRVDITDATVAAALAEQILHANNDSVLGKIETWGGYDMLPGEVTQFSNAYKDDYTAAVDLRILAIEYNYSEAKTIIWVSDE